MYMSESQQIDLAEGRLSHLCTRPLTLKEKRKETVTGSEWVVRSRKAV